MDFVPRFLGTGDTDFGLSVTLSFPCDDSRKYYRISFKFETMLAHMNTLVGIGFGLSVCPGAEAGDINSMNLLVNFFSHLFKRNSLKHRSVLFYVIFVRTQRKRKKILLVRVANKKKNRIYM